MSLWQVPPHSHLPLLPLHHSPFFSISSRTWPGLLLWQVSPSNLLPPSSSYLLPHHPHHSGPACHCGRSRQDPSTLSLHLHLSGLFTLCKIFGPAYHCGRSRLLHLLHLHYLPFTPSLHSVLFPPSEARLVIVAGPAWSSPSTSRPYFFSLLLSPLPLPSLSSCRPARAGRHGRSKVILLPLFQLRSTSDLTGFPALREVPVPWIVWLCLTFRDHVTMMDYVAWRCFASTSFVVVMVRYYVLAECFQLYKTI